MLFVFDRETGVPVIPFAERPVPESRIPGRACVRLRNRSPHCRRWFRSARCSHKTSGGLAFWDRGKCRDRIDAEFATTGFSRPPIGADRCFIPASSAASTGVGSPSIPVRQRVIAAVNQLPFVVTLLERPEWERELSRDNRPGRDFERAAVQLADGNVVSASGASRCCRPFGVPCTAPSVGHAR